MMEVGGIAQETVTEDAHTALKLHARGWKSIYLDIPQAAGLATERFGFHVQQRIRWARGMTQILRLDNPLTKRGLKMAQRINYANAAGHFLFGVPRLIYLLAPAAYLVLGFHPLNADVREVLIYALPHLFLALACGTSVNRNTRYSFWPEVFETSIAWYTARVTSVALIAPRYGSFNVTPKGEQLERSEFDWRSAFPMLVIFFVSLTAMALWPARLASTPSQWDTIAVAGFWNFYNLIILASALAAAHERPQRRMFTRIRCSGWVGLAEAPDGDKSPASLDVERVGELLDLSEGGARFLLDTAEPVPARVKLTVTTPSGLLVGVAALGVDEQPELLDLHLALTVRVPEHLDPLLPGFRGELPPELAGVALDPTGEVVEHVVPGAVDDDADVATAAGELELEADHTRLVGARHQGPVQGEGIEAFFAGHPPQVVAQARAVAVGHRDRALPAHAGTVVPPPGVQRRPGPALVRASVVVHPHHRVVGYLRQGLEEPAGRHPDHRHAESTVRATGSATRGGQMR